MNTPTNTTPNRRDEDGIHLKPSTYRIPGLLDETEPETDRADTGYYDINDLDD